MSQNTNPPWLREESYEPLQQSTAAVESSYSQASAATDSKQSKLLFWIMKAVTMILCVLMFVTAIIGFGKFYGSLFFSFAIIFLLTGSINDVDSVGKIFIAVYMLFFSMLLFVFEAVEIKPMQYVDHMLRRNFGFLYNAMGKAFFIIL